MRRGRVITGLAAVGAVLWVTVAFVALRRGDDGDGDAGSENPVDELLSDRELDLIHEATPDPACASEPTASPDDDSLVTLDVVRVDGTCLDAATEYVAAAEVDARLAELEDDPHVVAAATAPPPAVPTQVDDHRRDEQWALDALGAAEGSTELPWPDGTGVVVAVLDSGIDADHAELTDAVAGRRRHPDESTLDPDGHGTAMAGIIAARRDNGGIVGVTPQVSILDVPTRLWNAEHHLDPWEVTLAWAVNHGADVANMSFTFPDDEYEDEARMKVALAAVEFARNNDVVLVASGGNCANRENVAEECPERNTRTVPALLPGVVGSRGEHPLGRACDFMMANGGNEPDAYHLEQGWRMANLLVQKADEWGITYVIWQDQIWSKSRRSQGWREHTCLAPPCNLTEDHYDHVHVSVDS